MTDLPDIEDFWQWALQRWSQPGLAAALLPFQDQHGCVVLELLLLAWLDSRNLKLSPSGYGGLWTQRPAGTPRWCCRCVRSGSVGGINRTWQVSASVCKSWSWRRSAPLQGCILNSSVSCLLLTFLFPIWQSHQATLSWLFRPPRHRCLKGK